ncbi:hypothetical protein [Marivivens aquimaris]|uniref:hypothetical protein n=1 Tax=Marivivens aquimaris TaxID=2774876 RepID=UPI00187E289B|nr:hypothetical protein [Marivivens aquimaris]
MTEEITTNAMLRCKAKTQPDDVLARTDRLLLRAAPNGGWIVLAHSDHPVYQDDVIGAYGSAAEMIDALRGALVPQSN